MRVYVYGEDLCGADVCVCVCVRVCFVSRIGERKKEYKRKKHLRSLKVGSHLCFRTLELIY